MAPIPLFVLILIKMLHCVTRNANWPRKKNFAPIWPWIFSVYHFISLMESYFQCDINHCTWIYVNEKQIRILNHQLNFLSTVLKLSCQTFSSPWNERGRLWIGRMKMEEENFWLEIWRGWKKIKAGFTISFSGLQLYSTFTDDRYVLGDTNIAHSLCFNDLCWTHWSTT